MRTLGSQLAALAAFLGGLFSTHVTAAERSGLIGAKLAEARKTNDFFVFFHLMPDQSDSLPGGRTETFFRPTGEDFRPLVTLRVTTDARDKIQELDLSIVRSFIDDPKKSIYAADLAKSFLGDAADPANLGEVHALAREISARAMTHSTLTLLTAQPPPTVSGAPSPAYRIYAGAPETATLSYPSGQVELTLKNETEGGQVILHLIVRPRR